ncbi:polymeric immunoglobulin receptor-like isoform X4, partial [Clarias magur]
LPASHCDSASSISTAQLPTRSDSSTSSVEKSAEGLSYATVRFHSDGSSANDAALKIKFKKESESCEYAT